eukprot:1453478-Pleurochrysis_carterae.AAC.1
MRPSAASEGHEWAIVRVVGIKDGEARNKAVPTPLRRRQQQGSRGSDPLCAYDALRSLWAESGAQERAGRSGPDREPIFRAPDGRAWSSTQSRVLAKEMVIRRAHFYA